MVAVIERVLNTNKHECHAHCVCVCVRCASLLRNNNSQDARSFMVCPIASARKYVIKMDRSLAGVQV